MGEVIKLGKVQRKKMVDNKNYQEKTPIVVKAIHVLGTYGLKFIDTEIICKSIYQGKRTAEEVAVFYLNWMLERRLGPGWFLRFDSKIAVDKFVGIDYFKHEGPGPLRWTVEKINRGKFSNLQQAWQKINQNDEPGGGLFFVEDFYKNRFLFDPLGKKYRKGKFTIGRCWAYRDGREFFLINNVQENFFVPDQGQTTFEALEEVLAFI